MPIPLKPLRPEDGPAARFALALRALRDRAGTENPTLFSVDAVSRATGISRQTIFAALGGRIPNRATLTRIVQAWGGDPVEWIQRKAATENEIQLGSAPVHFATDSQRKRNRSSPREVARWRARNADRAAATREAVRELRELSPTATQASPVAQDFAQRLDQLRRDSGLSLREISRRAGKSERRRDEFKDRLPVANLSYIFRGLRFAHWYAVEIIVSTLEGDVEEWRALWIDMARKVGVWTRWADKYEDDEPLEVT